jgi:hypothetical protein
MAITLAAVATLSVAGCKKQPTTPPDGGTPSADDEDDDEQDDVEAPEDDDTEAATPLDKASFDETIHEHFSEVSDCYVIALESNSGLQGKLNAEFKIGADGKVVGITALDDSTLKDEGLLACINQAATTWTFALPPHGEMSLRYTYNLAPG